MDDGKIHNYVSSYRCPKLKNLRFCRLALSNEETAAAFKALETGVTAIDLSTLNTTRITCYDDTTVSAKDFFFRDGVINVVEGKVVEVKRSHCWW